MSDVVLDKPWLSIRWDRLHGCVLAEFRSFATSEEFRTGTMVILEAIRRNHADALISDNRKLEGVSVPDQLWLRDTWLSLAVAAGMKRIAVVVAARGLGRVASEAIISTFGDKALETRMFPSMAEAVSWLDER